MKTFQIWLALVIVVALIVGVVVAIDRSEDNKVREAILADGLVEHTIQPRESWWKYVENLPDRNEYRTDRLVEQLRKINRENGYNADTVLLAGPGSPVIVLVPASYEQATE